MANAIAHWNGSLRKTYFEVTSGFFLTLTPL